MSDELSPGYENSYALVVGINEYESPQFSPLGEAEDDAESIAEVLSKEPHNFMVRTLLGRDATKRAVLQTMYQLRETSPNDRILVYFACHGYTLTDRFGKEAGYLAMADTIPAQDFTAMHMEEVLNLRRHANAKHIAFIFDACFSGQALGLTRSQSVSAEKFLLRRAYQVISAGAGHETVDDLYSMTNVLVEALSGSMQSGDGVFTLNDLGGMVQHTLAEDTESSQIPQFGHLRGSQGGDFVFLIEDGGAIPYEIMSALSSDNYHLRWGGIATLIEMIGHEDCDAMLYEAARRRLQEVAADESEDPRIREVAQNFFRMEEAETAKLAGKLSEDEAEEQIESARQQLDQMKAAYREETGQDVEAAADDLAHARSLSGGELSRDELDHEADTIEASPATARPGRGPSISGKKVAPRGKLSRWDNVRGRIADALTELEDAHDPEARTEKYTDHNAPTLMRSMRMDDLQDLLDNDDDS